MNLFKAASWNAVGTVAGRASGFLTGVIVARALGTEGYGTFSLIYGIVPVIQSIGNVGLQIGGTRDVAMAIGRSESPDIIGLRAGVLIQVSIMLGLISALIMIVIGLICGGPNTYLLSSGAIVMIAPVASTGLTGIINAFHRYELISVQGICSLLLMPAGAWIGSRAGPDGALLGVGIASLISLAVLFVGVRQAAIVVGYRLQATYEWSVLVKCVHQVGPMALITIFYLPVEWWCQWYLSHQANGKHELGLFSMGRQWTALVLLLPGLFAGPLLAKLSRFHGAGDVVSMHRLIKKSLLWSFAGSAGTAIAVAVGIPWITGIYGKGYAGGSLVVGISLAYAVVWGIDMALGTLLLATNAIKWAIGSLVIRTAVLLLCPLVISVDGVALAVVILISNICLLGAHFAYYCQWRRKCLV